MPTPAEKDSERSSRQRGSAECKPLLDAATKDLYRNNAFRITGLPVDASVREITKHEDRLTQMTKLGLGDSANTSAFALKPPPTLAQLHEAHQKLKDPERRLLDEFFWFWPEEFGQSRTDPAILALQAGDGDTAFDIWSRKETDPKSGVVALHNVALVWHLTALEWEGYTTNAGPDADRQAKLEGYWRSAFKRWEQLVMSDDLWDHLTARIRQINEPDRLPTGFARRVRATLPQALRKINAELAVAYAECDKSELARLHIRFMRETNHGLDTVEKTAELVLAPAKKRLQEQVRRAKDCTDKTPRDAPSAARQLLDQARHTITLFDLFLGKESTSRNELSDESASMCNRLVIAYHKDTADNKTSLDILQAALPFATSAELTQLITHNVRWFTLSVIGESEDHPRSRLDRFNSEAIPAPPSTAATPSATSDNGLFDHAASVLRGISLDAWNKFHDAPTAVAANDLAIKYACQPDLKQRLLVDRATLKNNVEEQRNQVYFGTQQRQPEEPSFAERWEAKHQAAAQKLKREAPNKAGIGCLVVVAIFIVIGVIGSFDSTSKSSSGTSYTPPSSSTSPTYAPPPDPAPTYRPAPTFQAVAPGSTTYRVPHSASAALRGDKSEIESERTTIEALETQVESLGREIESDRLSLDRTSQSAVDEFNAKVGRYNSLAQKAKLANAAFNQKVDSYNAKLRQYAQ